jgi:DNA-binding IclR family transcriptional regulator
VADLASAAGLPLGVVRVLLSDLVDAGLVQVSRQAPSGWVTDRTLLRKVLDGLHSL